MARAKKVRVYDLAKELGIDPAKKLVELLQRLGEDVKQPSSSIDEEKAELVRQLIAEERGGAQPAAALAEGAVAVAEADAKPVEVVREEKQRKRKIHLSEGQIIVRDFAALVRMNPQEVVRKLMDMGIVRPAHTPIDFEIACKLAEEFGFEVTTEAPKPKVIKPPPPRRKPAVPPQPKPAPTESETPTAVEAMPPLPEAAPKLEVAPPPEEEVVEALAPVKIDSLTAEEMPGVVVERMEPRPPVVTVMGHVDHGKTTLLDTIRKTNIATQEVGQITQHVGAYEVEHDGKHIVFIDTPGHEAFTQLRVRGAQVTDIVVLVVAADDGVMPQTIEALNHAKAAEVPIIVAVNKIDRPDANPDRVKQQLAQLEVIPVEWGGEYEFVELSALRGDGIERLLDTIIAVAELHDFKADPKAPAQGVILEAKMDPLRGPVATLLVQHGVLKVGDAVVAGTTFGRVRLMTNHRGEAIKEAGPSTPVGIYGLEEVPEAGDRLIVVQDTRKARELAEERRMKVKAQFVQPLRPLSLEQVFSQMREGWLKELKLIVKADVHGSLEAITTKLLNMRHPEVKINVIHSGIGNVSESDVMLAAASQAIIIGFNVQEDASAKRARQVEPVDVRLYQIIYELIDDVKRAIVGMLEPVRREEVVGVAEVRATFRISRVGLVAGCVVQRGRVVRGARCRVRRDGQILHEGRIVSLRHYQEDRAEIPEGMECGLSVEGFSAFQEGDLIEVVAVTELPRGVEEVRERPTRLVGASTN